MFDDKINVFNLLSACCIGSYLTCDNININMYIYKSIAKLGISYMVYAIFRDKENKSDIQHIHMQVDKIYCLNKIYRFSLYNIEIKKKEEK